MRTVTKRASDSAPAQPGGMHVAHSAAARVVLFALVISVLGLSLSGCVFFPRIVSRALAAPAPDPLSSSAETSLETAPISGQQEVSIQGGEVAATPVAKANASEVTRRQLRIFNELWTTVNERYIYADFNGVDWGAARVEVEARISAGLSDEQFYDVMRELVQSLGDDHSKFLSPDEVAEEEEEYAGTGNFVGIGILTDFNPDTGRVYVLQVVPNSPAKAAGIQSHDHILKANGQPIVDANGEPDLSLLRGPEGTTVTVTVRTPGLDPRDLLIRRKKLPSAEFVEYRILQDKPRIGYILIPTFFEDSIDRQVRAALRALMREDGRSRRLDGLVVDMRINGGGAYPILTASLGFFTSGTLGYLVDRDEMRLPIRARAERIGNSQTVPVVVLIGPSTQSYAEVFAGILRDKGRAALVGQMSGGNVETLHANVFEDGSMAWIAEETFQLPNGSNWEGQGLAPDVAIDKAWDEYTADEDPAIQAAIQELSH